MDDNPERRDRTRFPHETLLTLENEEIGQLHGVRMYNFSRSGVYFETNFYLQPGTDLFVGIQSSPFAEKSDVYECYRAVIKWRKYLEESSYDYGYGLELIEKAPEGSLKPENAESRKHERKKCSIPAVISTPSETSDVLINNISKGGIFFKTHQFAEKLCQHKRRTCTRSAHTQTGASLAHILLKE